MNLSSLLCRGNVGAIAINAIASLGDNHVEIRGILLPRDLSDLEAMIESLFGREAEIKGSYIAMVNGVLVRAGGELDYTVATLRNYSRQIFVRFGGSVIGSIFWKSPMANPTPFEGYASSLRGFHKAKNDDSIAIVSLSVCEGDTEVKTVIGAVADGVGGTKRGELASAEAITLFFADIAKSFVEKISIDREALLRALERANRAILELSKAIGMRIATTFTLASIYGNTLNVLHLGDTRAYLVTDKPMRLTMDHRIQGSKVITKALGISEKIEPEEHSYTLPPNATLILCSDGVYDSIGEGKMLKIARKYSPREAVSKVLNAVAKKKGRDDASIAIVRWSR